MIENVLICLELYKIMNFFDLLQYFEQAYYEVIIWIIDWENFILIHFYLKFLFFNKQEFII